MPCAQAALEEAERLAHAHPQTPRAPGWVMSFGVRSWLAQGHLEAAARWVQQSGLKIDDVVSYLREAEYLALGRVLLRLKLSVSKRAVMAGMTSAAAMSVTPSICMEAMRAAASASEKNVSTHSVRTPYTCATSELKVVNNSCLYKKKMMVATISDTALSLGSCGRAVWGRPHPASRLTLRSIPSTGRLCA